MNAETPLTRGRPVRAGLRLGPVRRHRWWLGLTGALIGILCLIAPPTTAGTAATITAAEVEALARETRLALALSQPVRFDVFTLSGPHRLVIDLPDVEWALPDRTIVLNRGPIERLRFGRHKPGVSRIVADLSAGSIVRDAALVPASADTSHRLIVTMSTAGRPGSDWRRASPRPATIGDVAVVKAAGLPPPRQKPATRVVVLDPGHGGKDPGGIGVSGVYEKTVTLLTARQVREALQPLGRYKVILTRNGDTFIPLRSRVAIAQRAKADLFVSLHADARANPATRGASVYTLSQEASDAEAAALAQRENEADRIGAVGPIHAGRDISGILINLVQRDTMNRSARLAAMMVDALAGQTLLLPNSHRFAGFAVLKAPDVPAVLVELGFLSNADDEALLRSPHHRQKLAATIAEAIHAYFEDSTVAARD